MDKPFVISLKKVEDARGILSFVDKNSDLPFKIERVYWLSQVPDQQIRGDHAHKASRQIIICISGKILVSLESQEGQIEEFMLDDPSVGLYSPPLWWGKMVFHNATMVGLASDQFDESDYIRRREEF